MLTDLILKNSAYLVMPLISFVISLMLTKQLITILPKLGLMDIPGGRHIHKKITPKGGGLAIIFAFFISWFLMFISPWGYFQGSMDSSFLIKLIIPSVILVTVGVIDDKYAIRARYKLLGQIIVAALCWYLGIRFDNLLGYELPPILSLPFTIIWITSFVNAFNLIDGMDGLASGLAVVTSICMATVFAIQHAPMDTVVILMFGTACLGFLRYNFYPAQLFLGDTGSMFIGFIFAIVGIVSSSKSATFSAVLIPILASGVPIFDVILAIWRRTAKKVVNKLSDTNIIDLSGDDEEGDGSQVMGADKEHLHHRILEKDDNQHRAAITMYFIALAFGIASLSLFILEDTSQGTAFLIVLIVVVTAVRRLATVELWNSTKAIIRGIHRPQKGLVVSLVHPFYDLIALLVTFVMSYFLFRVSSYTQFVQHQLYIDLLYSLFPVVLLLNLGGAYKRYWVRASSLDYMHITKLLLAGFFISVVVNSYISDITDMRLFIARNMLVVFMSCFFIVGERLLLRYVKTTFLHRTYIRNNFHTDIKRVLIYGGGLNCYYFLNHVSSFIEKNPMRIVGIIDDYPAFWDRYIYGYKVLGSHTDLEQIYAVKPFDRIVISSQNIKPDRMKVLKEFCSTNSIELTQLKSDEVDIG